MSYPNISTTRILTDLDDINFIDSNIGIIKSTSEKVYMKTAEDNDSKIIRLITEYNQLVKCTHPCIQTVVGFYHPNNSNKYCLLTLFQSNQSLNEFSDLNITQKIIVILGIALGMEYLHDIVNVLHCQLNPNHILLDSYKNPILIGFGKFNSNERPERNDLFEEPEIDTYDKKSDIFSFGLLINYIFSKKIPFSNFSYQEKCQIIRNNRFEVDSTIPEFLQDIIRNCLNSNREQRPTFTEIISSIENSIREIDSEDGLIQLFYEKVKIQSKEKRIFKIPKQLIKFPPNDEIDEDELEKFNPIDLDSFINFLSLNSSGLNAIFVFTFGSYQNGKSTFIKILTGNQAHVTNNIQIHSNTKGVLIDGPYSKSELLSNIIFSEIIDQFEFIDNNDTQVYFIDSQGIENDDYKFKSLFEKVYPIFCSISTVCISIANPNESINFLKQIVRQTQLFPTNKSTRVYLLIKNFYLFDSSENLSYDHFTSYENEFQNHFSKLYDESNCLTILPLGNSNKNYKKYIYNVWYIFLSILSNINEDNLLNSETITKVLFTLSGGFFSSHFLLMKKKLNINHKSLKKVSNEYQIENIINNYTSFINNEINELLSMKENVTSQLSMMVSRFKISDVIEYYINLSSNFILPFIIKEYDIPFIYIIQYSEILTKDINSILRSKQKGTIKCIKYTDISIDIFDKVLSKESSIFQPIIDFKEFLNDSTSKNDSKIVKSSLVPFIWDYQLIESKNKKIDVKSKKSIGKDKEQLIIFVEQPDNDSTLLFRALTGIDVNFKGQKIVSQLFQNVPIEKNMIRFRRIGNPNVSKLLDPPIKKVHFLYLKGYSQETLTKLCSIQKWKPIVVSSMKDGQKIDLCPPTNFVYHMFVISPESYKFLTVRRQCYLKNMIEAKNIMLSIVPDMKNVNLLPINSNDFKFDKAGPVAHELIKFGCRFILKDATFYKDE